MVDKTIGVLTQIVRPLATDQYEAESVSEGTVRIDFDTLRCGPMLPAVSQALGFTIANIVEVEAATKAMRVTVRPADLGQGQDQMFAVTRHAVGVQTLLTLTTSAYSDFVFVAGWWSFAGIAFLNKCDVALCTSAVSGARAGVSMLRLCSVAPMLGAGAATQVVVPPIGTPVPNVNNALYNSLRTDQPPPQLFITAAVSSTTVPITGIEVYSKPLGLAIGSTRLLAGEQNIAPQRIFDAAANGSYQPYTMPLNTGFTISGEGPAAGTSQTLNVSANFQWDEWIPVPPDRI